MDKIYTALGLMSGTSMDGVDVSIIKSDGHCQFSNILDNYYEFDNKLRQKLLKLRYSISTKKDLIEFSKDLKVLERDLTIFHKEIIDQTSSKFSEKIDLLGFHGQTIFHDPEIKITKQLGDGNLLSQLTRKIVIYNFRQNDLKNGGQGAPLTPIFHNLLANIIYNKNKNELFDIMNIGGISNITKTIKNKEFSNSSIEAFDIGPGNCLIDSWVQKNSNKKYDKDGLIAKTGKINKLILNQAIENFRLNSYEKSLDIKDFDISFAKGLSLEDGCATITNFTAYLISEGIRFINNDNLNDCKKILVCGGGRKNVTLMETIKEYLNDYKGLKIDLIDKFNFDGDFTESQAFGYLAIRSYLGLPISFPNTTRCKKPSLGGELVRNF